MQKQEDVVARATSKVQELREELAARLGATHFPGNGFYIPPIKMLLGDGADGIVLPVLPT